MVVRKINEFSGGLVSPLLVGDGLGGAGSVAGGDGTFGVCFAVG